jgi:hypothetical protein
MRHQSPKPFNIWIALAACAGLVLGGGIAAWLLLKGAPLIIPIVVRAQSSGGAGEGEAKGSDGGADG